MTVELSPATAAFLGEVMPAIVGTRRRGGAVKLNPAWYEFADGEFRLASWRGAHWLAHLERERAATLLFLDPRDMYRVVTAETTLVHAGTDGGRERMDRLSYRYTGGPYRFAMSADLVRIDLAPVRVVSSLDAT